LDEQRFGLLRNKKIQIFKVSFQEQKFMDEPVIVVSLHNCRHEAESIM